MTERESRAGAEAQAFENGYQQGYADAINDLEEKLNDMGTKVPLIFNFPVEEILGEDIDMDMNFIEFVEKILDIKLLPYQKKFLRDIENAPTESQIIYERDSDPSSIYFYGWIYKRLWEEYFKRGD